MGPDNHVALIQAAGPYVATAITGVFAYAGGHKAGKASFIKAVQDAAAQVIKSLQDEVERLTRRVGNAETACDRSAAAHEACEKKLSQMAEQIDALMKGPVATYAPRIPGKRP